MQLPPQRAVEQSRFVRRPATAPIQYVAPGVHLAIGLYRDCGQAGGPPRVCWVSARPSSRRSGGLITTSRDRHPAPPVVAGNRDVVGDLALGHSGRHRTDDDLGHQLGRDQRIGIGPFFRSWMSCEGSSIGKDVMGRRRRNEAHAATEKLSIGDVIRYLVVRAAARLSQGFAPCAIVIWIWSDEAEGNGGGRRSARCHLLDAPSAKRSPAFCLSHASMRRCPAGTPAFRRLDQRLAFG